MRGAYHRTQGTTFSSYAQRLDLQSQRIAIACCQDFKVNDARRLVEQLTAELERGSRILSPADAVLSSQGVQRRPYLLWGRRLSRSRSLAGPGGDRLHAGRTAAKISGRAWRFCRANNRQAEEYGAIVGTLVAVSDFP